MRKSAFQTYQTSGAFRLIDKGDLPAKPGRGRSFVDPKKDGALYLATLMLGICRRKTKGLGEGEEKAPLKITFIQIQKHNRSSFVKVRHKISAL